MSKYDEIYKQNQNVFGVEPTPMVKSLLKYISSGSVLDIGAGEGRNSLFLSSKGFDVTALDPSPVAMEKVNQTAKENNIVVKTMMADINKFQFPHKYDVIVANLIFHHLTKDEAYSVINKIRTHTNLAGFNVVNVITKNGDFYLDNPNTDKFYAETNEIKKIYFDWKILEFQSRRWQAFQKRADGSPMFNVSEELMVQSI